LAAPQHILAFRFSALGDTAMTVPVMNLLLQQYPQLEVTFVSQPMMRPLFEGIERLHFFPADIKKEYTGITGLYKLSQRLKKEVNADAIADLHDVVRTKLLRFYMMGTRTAVIDKGRKEKEELIRPVNKILRPLKTTFERYADVLKELGLPVRLDVKAGIMHRSPNTTLIPGADDAHVLIGVAPFAKHNAKMYPPDKMKQVVKLIARRNDVKILLFGGPAEADVLEQWERDIPHVHSLAGKMKFAGELMVISQLDVMVSMDSANMHLASLYGVPVISIWGGTHPYLGFYGWGQSFGDAVQLDLPCRPSSVFGNKDCPVHGKEGCMQGITPEMIVERVNNHSATIKMN
jgi:ADP-heptose:LPS heptosyltransferase